MSVKNKIPSYQDSDIITTFQHGCRDKGISNALARRCVQTLPELSDLVSRFCTIEDAWVAKKSTDSICEHKLKRERPAPRCAPRAGTIPTKRPRKKKKTSALPRTTLNGLLDKPCPIHVVLLNSCQTHSLRNCWVVRQVANRGPALLTGTPCHAEESSDEGEVMMIYETFTSNNQRKRAL